MWPGPGVPNVPGMRILGLLAPALVLGCLSGCAIGGPPRAEETDEVAQVVALAIDSPRQADAVGYARAAMDTRAARDGRLTVVRVTAGHLVLRVHLEAYDDTTSFTFDPHEPEVFTCYELEVGVSGVSGPERRPCPAGAAPVPLPPPPPVMEIPTGADAVVSAALRRTSSNPEAVVADVRRRLRPPTSRALPPEVAAAAHGADVGVSVRGADSCLLGSRVDGRVLVWRPSRVQVQPGELSCDPATALGRLGVTPPH